MGLLWGRTRVVTPHLLLSAGYSILLFMNPLNFKFLQVPAVLFYTLTTFFKNKKNVWNIKNVKKTFFTSMVHSERVRMVTRSAVSNSDISTDNFSLFTNVRHLSPPVT